MQRVALLIRRNRQYQNINRRFPQQCEPGDVYVIRWYENKGTKTRYQNVGTDLNEASRLRLQKEMTLSQPTAEIVPERARFSGRGQAAHSQQGSLFCFMENMDAQDFFGNGAVSSGWCKRDVPESDVSGLTALQIDRPG